jgi:hypothetical protein
VAIPPAGVAIGAGIIAFDARATSQLRSTVVRDRLAAYFSSTEGQQLLSQQLSGVTVLRVTKSALEAAVVPRPELLVDLTPTTEGLLATRLEAALWN